MRIRFTYKGAIKEIARIFEWVGNTAIVEAKDGFIYPVEKWEMVMF